MSPRVACPKCRQIYEVTAQLAGKQARCQSCKTLFRFPSLPTNPAAAVTAPQPGPTPPAPAPAPMPAPAPTEAFAPESVARTVPARPAPRQAPDDAPKTRPGPVLSR